MEISEDAAIRLVGEEAESDNQPDQVDVADAFTVSRQNLFTDLCINDILGEHRLKTTQTRGRTGGVFPLTVHVAFPLRDWV